MKPGVNDRFGRRAGRGLVGLLVSLLVVGPSPVVPATITVGGACDLVEAIESANSDSGVGGCADGSGADTVVLTGDVTLTSVDNSTDGDNGLPSITSEITVDGAGNTISRDGGAPDFRIFHVASDGDLTLNNVTVSGGRLAGSDGKGAGAFNLGDLTLTSSTISGNVVDGAGYGYGGGIYNLGTAVLTSSAVMDNQLEATNAFGAGIFNGLGAVLNLQLSAVSGNDLTARVAGGGGFETWGIAVLTQSTVADNSVTLTGEYPTLFGAGISFASGSLTLSASTVSGNVGYSPSTAMDGYGALLFGGGLSVDDGLLNVSASTISGNSLTAADALFSAALGGGVDHGNDTGTVSFSTLSGNTVSAGLQADGGGIYAGPGANLNLIGVLVGDSVGDNCGGIGALNDIQNNLSDDDTCSTVPSTLTDLDPVLMDNGGPTETHRLLVGSNAIDNAGMCFIETDQRGVERDDLGGCDSGSYELNDCLAPDGNQAVADGTILGELLIEVCYLITTGGNLVVESSGDLLLRSGSRVSMGDGTVVEDGGQLTIEIDPVLQM